MSKSTFASLKDWGLTAGYTACYTWQAVMTPSFAYLPTDARVSRKQKINKTKQRPEITLMVKIHRPKAETPKNHTHRMRALMLAEWGPKSGTVSNSLLSSFLQRKHRCQVGAPETTKTPSLGEECTYISVRWCNRENSASGSVRNLLWLRSL